MGGGAVSHGAVGGEAVGAHVVGSDAEALQIADAFAATLRDGAAERDRQARVPVEELAALGRSGLLGLTVPARLGGADVSAVTLAEVFRRLAVADPSVAQVPQNHYVFVSVLRHDGTEEQQRRLLGDVLTGARFGNALSERGTKHVMDMRTRLLPAADGTLRLNGTKYYCTGALTATWIPVFALDEADRLVVAYVPRDADGVEVLQDWSAFGQRATMSGTTRLTDVAVAPENVVAHWHTYERPQVAGAFGQILHAAIDVGIAGAALADGARFVREQARPWFEAAEERAADEPHVLLRFGQLGAKVHAAEALLRRAAETLDAAAAQGPRPSAEAAGAASLAVAEAKAFGGDVAVEVASEIFGLMGASASDAAHDLDRHWRNARTHTLHDPARWKYVHNGNHIINGVLPPNHGLV
ncbi:SfnB family sulfur acquisition oxidoreductase [Pseudofrankia sp. EUN1h]|nr:SfnB family sulfur acquisition oxidoreductase [Pseudofrankia sp. EUN1h]